MTLSHSLAARHPNTLAGGETIRTDGALTTVLVLLFVSNTFDPGGALGLKYVVFLLLCASIIWTAKYVDLSSAEVVVGMVLFVIWPCWALLFGAMRKGDMVVGASQVTPFLFALVLAMILPAFNSRVALRLYYGCLLSLSIVVIISFLLIFFLPDNGITAALTGFFARLHESHEGYFGTKVWGAFEAPDVYFGSTLFLVPAFVYFLFVGKQVRAGIALLGLALAFSKAGVVICAGFAVIYWLRSLSSHFGSPAADEPQVKTGRKYLRAGFAAAVFAAIIAVVVVSFHGFAEDLGETFFAQSDTAAVRLGHIDSVLTLWRQNPRYLLVGQGVGVPFFTSGESEYVQNIEVDHLNTIRKFGLPWFFCFSGIVFYSAWRLIKASAVEMRAFGFALVSMYFAAGTNPVLLSPLFIMLMTLSFFAQRTLSARAS